MIRARGSKNKTANLQTVKQSNLTLLFGLISQRESVSRAELAQITGLSPTTVSSLVDELMEHQMVWETGVGQTVTSGRKPILLSVNPTGGYVAGVELGGDGLHLELCDLTGARCAQDTCEVEDFRRVDQTLIRAVKQLLDGQGVPEEKLLGLGIGVPGVIDKATGRIISSTVIPVEGCGDFIDRVRERLPGCKVRLGNESCFSAYMEKIKMERDVHSLVYVDINVGIGAGIILDDRIFTGAFGNAGELGHVSVDQDGPLCKCGNHGCLEVVANVPAIKARVAAETRRDLSLDQVRCGLEQGDEALHRVIGQVCRTLAVGFNSMINILNPEAIIIGGEITRLGPRFLQLVREQISEISFAPSTQELIVEFSGVEGNSVTQGAARYLLDSIFKADGITLY